MTRYINCRKFISKTDSETQPREPSHSEATFSIHRIHKDGRSDPNKRRRGKDQGVRRRLIRGRRGKSPDRNNCPVPQFAGDVELTKTGSSICFHNGGRVHSVCGSSKRCEMDKSILGRNPTGKEIPTNHLHGQRSCTQANQNTNFPSENPAYRPQVPFHTGTSGQQADPSIRNTGETEPYGPVNEAHPYEFGWPMEERTLHWLDIIR